MKCSQCDNEATKSGSGLCKECEKDVMEEYYKNEEDLLQEVYMDIVRSSY